jgi:hypothetical protein
MPWTTNPVKAPYPRRPLLERFLAKVTKTNSCWLWNGARQKRTGHGIYRDENHRQTSAHRVSWMLLVGPIPEGLWVLHDCPGGDNPRCVNPDHLFLGTPQDNLADMRSKGRQARGEKHGHAKLSEEDVRSIRRRYATGEAKQQELADEYKVGQGIISQIIHRKLWSHVA